MRTIALILALATAVLAQCSGGSVSYSSFTATGSQEIPILVGVSGSTRYDQITLSETTKFDNITGLKVSMGRPGSATHAEMLGGWFDLGVSSGAFNFWNARPVPPQLTSTYTIVLIFTVPSGTLNVAEAGVLTWEICGWNVPVVQSTYLVGDVFPYSSDDAPNFGDGVIDLTDLTQVLFAVNNVPGFRPAACSDRFDAMDLYPVDIGSTRGGDGVLDVRDLVREWSRASNLDLDRPVRPSRGRTCASIIGAAATQQRAGFLLRPPAGAHARLVLGVPEFSTGVVQRFPVYLEVGHNLIRVVVTFALGDQRSQLRFLPMPDTPPSLAYDGRLGVVALAWLDGVSLRGGERLLLGHVLGPVGASANLQVYGVSASGSDGDRDVLLDSSAMSETEAGNRPSDRQEQARRGLKLLGAMIGKVRSLMRPH
jgi:hypothetical protein